MSWWFAPYKRRDTRLGPGRYCAMDDFTDQLIADGADPSAPWSEAECLGNTAVVKVSAAASAATLQAINAAPGFTRVPVAHLDDSLASLTAAQQNQLVNFLESLGYTAAELQARFGGVDLSAFTLRDVLRFALTRRLRPRYDAPTDTIVLDGVRQPTLPVELVDATVS